MKNPSRKRGFTLVEFLVVIAIMSLLLAVVLASIKGARDLSIESKAKNDVAQIKLALQMYYHDNGGYPVCGNAALPQTYPQTCCIGGTSCYIGNTLVNGTLTELTAMLNKVKASQYASNVQNETATVYYPNKLVAPDKTVGYLCNSGNSLSGIALCADAIISYTLDNVVTVEPVTDPALNPGGAPCNDPGDTSYNQPGACSGVPNASGSY